MEDRPSPDTLHYGYPFDVGQGDKYCMLPPRPEPGSDLDTKVIGQQETLYTRLFTICTVNYLLGCEQRVGKSGHWQSPKRRKQRLGEVSGRGRRIP